jgi:hypothetical protein
LRTDFADDFEWISGSMDSALRGSFGTTFGIRYFHTDLGESHVEKTTDGGGVPLTCKPSDRAYSTLQSQNPGPEASGTGIAKASGGAKMMAKPLAVRVFVDPPHKSQPGRTRYRVTLACGCHWWEHRNATDPPPPSDTMHCCHKHPTGAPSPWSATSLTPAQFDPPRAVNPDASGPRVSDTPNWVLPKY